MNRVEDKRAGRKKELEMLYYIMKDKVGESVI